MNECIKCPIKKVVLTNFCNKVEECLCTSLYCIYVPKHDDDDVY